MADDRCVFPGDGESPTGRNPRRWLDRETAERLLNGESPDNAVAPEHRTEADRLARTLAALAAPALPLDEELPGEAAALAAFRKARADATPTTTPATAHAENSPDPAPAPATETAALAVFREARGSEPPGVVGKPGGAGGGETAALAAFRAARGSGASGVVRDAEGAGGGEAAALAAFRAARGSGASAVVRDAEPNGGGEAGAAAAFRAARAAEASGRQVEDAGLVRIGGRGSRARRSGWSRPARLGTAAALAVGMVGGVAVAAGTGVLPTPFDTAEPGPAASVSATPTPGPNRPLVSPSPKATPGAGKETGAPGAVSGSPAPDADGTGDDPAARDRDRSWPSGIPSACRDVRDGKVLDATRRRTLEGAAGGPARVPAYCAGVLENPTGQAPRTDDGRKDDTRGGAPTGGVGGTGGDRGDEDGREGNDGKGDKGGGGGSGNSTGSGRPGGSTGSTGSAGSSGSGRPGGSTGSGQGDRVDHSSALLPERSALSRL
ncbi:hypothetical protein [Streptomyces sp. A012304]|uniref:hypothetical protein n=1 Tax=Streptomyces sp. A012304 TaxID=375446 RepID=UPI0022306FAA|nr:hypothetical protein [Streptomyces sp. A012304]GKQ40936.1 hypothetical protein ALMP_74550 [Streptomyces sp. A012304]